jgi:hypothetical protein
MGKKSIGHKMFLIFLYKFYSKHFSLRQIFGVLHSKRTHKFPNIKVNKNPFSGYLIVACGCIQNGAWRWQSSGMLRRVGDHRPDDGGSKHLWNISQFLPNYTTQHPKRQSFSYLSSWDPEISFLWLRCQSAFCLLVLKPNRLVSRWKASVAPTYLVHTVVQSEESGPGDVSECEPVQSQEPNHTHCDQHAQEWRRWHCVRLRREGRIQGTTLLVAVYLTNQLRGAESVLRSW